MKISRTEEGVIIDVFVKPKSKTFAIAIEDEGIVVSCRNQPIEGKVNRELIKELSRLLHKKVHIVSGFTSRDKKLLIEDATTDYVQEILSK